MGYGKFTKIEKLGENRYKVYAVTYTKELAFASIDIWSKSKGRYYYTEFMNCINKDEWLNRYKILEKEDYDIINHPIKGYALPTGGGDAINASDHSHPFDNDIVYTEPVVVEEEKEKEEESAVVVVVKEPVYRDVKKADGNLWEFPYDGADYGNDILLQSRPIKLNSDDLKGSFRVVLRGLFVGVEGKSSGLYVSGSIDGKKWMYLGGTERKHVAGVPVRDIGTTIERNSCRFLMVVYVGCLLPESKIEYVDITSTIRYSDKPR